MSPADAEEFELGIFPENAFISPQDRQIITEIAYDRPQIKGLNPDWVADLIAQRLGFEWDPQHERIQNSEVFMDWITRETHFEFCYRLGVDDITEPIAPEVYNRVRTEVVMAAARRAIACIISWEGSVHPVHGKGEKNIRDTLGPSFGRVPKQNRGEEGMPSLAEIGQENLQYSQPVPPYGGPQGPVPNGRSGVSPDGGFMDVSD